MNAIDILADKGIKAGLIRPITLFPFPYESFARAAQQDSVKQFVDFEISAGQMIEDVRLGVEGKKPIAFRGWLDLALPTPTEMADFILSLKEGK